MGANIDFGLIHQTFFFIRHGQTDWNRNKIAMGQADVPLNEQGMAEACLAAEQLAECGIQKIFHSPLQRAASTANIIGELLHLPCQPIDALSQCNWGTMQGQPRGDESWRMAWRRGEIHINGAESFNEFAHRVCSGVNEALTHGKPILIVAHGATYAAIQRTIGLTDREMQNCAPLQYHPPERAGMQWRLTELAVLTD